MYCFEGKEIGLEALALKQSLIGCRTIIRWRRSAAQLGDVVTKESDVASAPWDLLVRRGFRRQLTHGPKSESSRNRAEGGGDILEYYPEEDVDIPRGTKNVSLLLDSAFQRGECQT